MIWSILADATRLYSVSQYLIVNNENITLFDTHYNPTNVGQVEYSLTICYENLTTCPISPLASPVLWIVTDLSDIPRIISVAQTLKIPIVIFVSDEYIPYYYVDDPLTILVFRMSIEDGKKISQMPPGLFGTVHYSKDTNCKLTYLPLIICGSTLFVFFLQVRSLKNSFGLLLCFYGL